MNQEIIEVIREELNKEFSKFPMRRGLIGEPVQEVKEESLGEMVLELTRREDGRRFR